MSDPTSHPRPQPASPREADQDARRKTQPGRGSAADTGPRWPAVVLIASVIAGYALSRRDPSLAARWVLNPLNLTATGFGAYWLVHSSLVHLIGNVLAIAVTVPLASRKLGPLTLLLVAAAATLMAGVAYVLVQWVGGGTLPLAGASGLVWGVIGGLLAVSPSASVWLGRRISIPLWGIAGAMVLWNAAGLLAAFSNVSATAYVAHLAGLTTGLLAVVAGRWIGGGVRPDPADAADSEGARGDNALATPAGSDRATAIRAGAMAASPLASPDEYAPEALSASAGTGESTAAIDRRATSDAIDPSDAFVTDSPVGPGPAAPHPPAANPTAGTSPASRPPASNTPLPDAAASWPPRLSDEHAATFQGASSASADPRLRHASEPISRQIVPVPPTPTEAYIDGLTAEFARTFASGDLPTAASLYVELARIGKTENVVRSAHLRMAGWLASEQRYAEAAEAYERFAANHPNYQQMEQVDLMVGLLYARYLDRPAAARPRLIHAAARLTDPAQLATAQAALESLERRLEGDRKG